MICENQIAQQYLFVKGLNSFEKSELGMLAYAFNPRTPEEVAGRYL